MGDKLTKGLIFAVGAVAGAAASMYFFKTKYERIADDEIEKARQLYRRKMDKLDEVVTEEKPSKEEPKSGRYPWKSDEDESNNTSENKERYSEMVKDLGYTEKKGDEDVKLPYVINQDEYGENSDYELVSLTYYADQKLEDEEGKLIEDIDYHVGWDNLEEFEDGVVFVRNDELKKDFEIVKTDYDYYEEAY